MQPYPTLQLLGSLAFNVWTHDAPTIPRISHQRSRFLPARSLLPRMRMRTEMKIFYVPRFLGWVVGGDYEVLTSLLRDDRLSLRFHDWEYYPRIPEAKKNDLNRLTDNLLMAKHRADHQRLRRLSVTAFAPRMVDK